MDSSVQCVIDRRMAHACTSVATDGGEKTTAAEPTEEEPSLQCPVLLFMSDPVLWGFKKTRQSSEKRLPKEAAYRGPHYLQKQHREPRI